MNEWISNPPLPVLAGAAVVGVLLLVYAVSKALKKLIKLGLLVVAVVAIWFGISRYLESGAEKVVRETKELASAADRRDWTAFSKLLDSKVTFASYGDRDALTRGAALTIDKVGVKNVTLTDFETKEEPGGYAVTFAAYADIAAISQRAPTNWKLFWSKNPNGSDYLLNRIEVLPTGQFGTDLVLSRLAR